MARVPGAQIEGSRYNTFDSKYFVRPRVTGSFDSRTSLVYIMGSINGNVLIYARNFETKFVVTTNMGCSFEKSY